VKFSSEKLRVSLMLLALLLFFARVVGQIEVLLLGPKWLPPMEVWFSGLLPYPILLPLQILLLMFMSLVACDHVRGRGFFRPSRPTVRFALRAFAVVYVSVMAIRLAVAMSEPPHDLLESGVIPIAFHWVLAAFVWLVSLAPVRSESVPATQESWDQELLERVHVNGRERILHVSAKELVRLRRLLDA
jgi:hypothetical protein